MSLPSSKHSQPSIQQSSCIFRSKGCCCRQHEIRRWRHLTCPEFEQRKFWKVKIFSTSALVGGCNVINKDPHIFSSDQLVTGKLSKDRGSFGYFWDSQREKNWGRKSIENVYKTFQHQLTLLFSRARKSLILVLELRLSETCDTVQDGLAITPRICLPDELDPKDHYTPGCPLARPDTRTHRRYIRQHPLPHVHT